MRVTTAFSYATSLSNLQKRQTELNEANGRMTSGKRVEKASDDPAAAGRAERALAIVNRSDANQRLRGRKVLALRQFDALPGVRP